MHSARDIAPAGSHGKLGLYLVTSALLIVLVIAGFSRTFFLRSLFQESLLPGYLILHGVTQTAWMFGFLVQALCVWRGRSDLHRRMGPIIATVGAIACLTALYVALRVLYNVRDGSAVPDGTVERVTGGVIWNFALAILFGAFLIMGVLLRRRRSMHKRLMLLALITSTVAPAAVRLPFHLGTAAIFGIPIALIARNVVLRRQPHWISVAGGTTFIGVFLICMFVLGNFEWAQHFVLGSAQ